MAKMQHNLDGLITLFDTLAKVPTEAAAEILAAQADVVADVQREEAAKLNNSNYANYRSNGVFKSGKHKGQANAFIGGGPDQSTGDLARSIRVTPAFATTNQHGAAVHRVRVFFAGSRRRGNTITNNAEIAFYNQYGNAHINGRQWLTRANVKATAAARAAGEAAYKKWLADHGVT